MQQADEPDLVGSVDALAELANSLGDANPFELASMSQLEIKELVTEQINSPMAKSFLDEPEQDLGGLLLRPRVGYGSPTKERAKPKDGFASADGGVWPRLLPPAKSSKVKEIFGQQINGHIMQPPEEEPEWEEGEKAMPGTATSVLAKMPDEPSVVIGDGRKGEGKQQLDESFGCAYMTSIADSVLTVDCNNHRVKMHDCRSSGKMQCALGGPDDDQFNCPWGIATSSNGTHLVVSDAGNHRLQVLRIQNDPVKGYTIRFVRMIGGGMGSQEGQLHNPRGVAVLKRGDAESVIVADSANQRVQEFDFETGALMRVVGCEGEEDGQFNHPFDVTALPDGGFAVADYWNFRIQVFDEEANFKLSFGGPGTTDGLFECPTALASDQYGNLLVVDRDTNRLQVFSTDGQHQSTRDDLGLREGTHKGISWRPRDGHIPCALAISGGKANRVCVWNEQRRMIKKLKSAVSKTATLAKLFKL
jgi:hypothetical protein